VARPARLQRPDVGIVLRDQGPSGRLVVPGDAPALQHGARARPEVGHEALHDPRLAVEADAERVAHLAAAAIAPDEIAAADLLGLAVAVAQRGAYSFGILRQRLERDAPARVRAGLRQHGALQHRLDLDL